MKNAHHPIVEVSALGGGYNVTWQLAKFGTVQGKNFPGGAEGFLAAYRFAQGFVHRPSVFCEIPNEIETKDL